MNDKSLGLFYVSMGLLAACGIGFVYTSSADKKMNEEKEKQKGNAIVVVDGEATVYNFNSLDYVTTDTWSPDDSIVYYELPGQPDEKYYQYKDVSSIILHTIDSEDIVVDPNQTYIIQGADSFDYAYSLALNYDEDGVVNVHEKDNNSKKLTLTNNVKTRQF